MLAEELDLELEELDTRLERLRALYEQYFIGIEKIEPAIARKDVDRRIWTLRREKIRNTAKRFKLQTIIQRYNSYQQYWRRILREIEAGTFKRHVRKAELITGQDLLTIQSRRRHKRTLKELDEARQLTALTSSPQAEPPESGPPLRAAPVPSPHHRSSRPPPSAGILPRPGLSGGRRPSQVPPPDAAPGQRPQTLPGTTLSALLGQRAAAPGQAPLTASLRRAPLPTQPGARAAPFTALSPPFPPKPPAPKAPPAAPSSLTSPDAAVAAPRPAPAPPPPLAGARPAPVPPPARLPLPAPRPPPVAVAKPAPAPLPAPIGKPAQAAAAKTVEALTETRIQQLHERLTHARRQAGDATELTLAGLARSIRTTEAKLREQHHGREIDFDVHVKDGKAVLRPVLKKTKEE